MLDATAGATITGGGIRFTRVAGFSGQVGDELDFFANTGLSIDPSVTITDASGLGLLFDPVSGIATVTQTPPGASACANGEDDDGHGFVDLLDSGCTNADDASELAATPRCDDGVDNDGDGLADTADPGCPFPVAPYEDPPCDNGIDDDGDGSVDADDSVCHLSWPYWEAMPGSCGLGAELIFVVPALSWLRRGRRIRAR